MQCEYAKDLDLLLTWDQTLRIYGVTTRTLQMVRSGYSAGWSLKRSSMCALEYYVQLGVDSTIFARTLLIPHNTGPGV